MSVPISFDAFFDGILERDRRIPDGKLHPSSHLTGHLRHTMLDLAGAPKRVNGFANSMRLMSGTFFHEAIHDHMRRTGIPVMPEVKLDRWLPDGWAGTADCLMWNAEHRAFALIDYKTIQGTGLYWIDRMGAKESHIWQLSAYLYAAEEMGIPVFTDEAYILYLPITEDPKAGMGTQSWMMSLVKPLDKEMLHKHMADIKSKTDAYTVSILPSIDGPERYLTPYLSDPPAREQKLFWDKDKKIWHVRYVPPWGAKYCQYEAPLCTCSDLKTEKIGEYGLDKEYVPRGGYEDIVPMDLSDSEVKRRSK